MLAFRARLLPRQAGPFAWMRAWGGEGWGEGLERWTHVRGEDGHRGTARGQRKGCVGAREGGIKKAQNAGAEGKGAGHVGYLYQPVRPLQFLSEICTVDAAIQVVPCISKTTRASEDVLSEICTASTTRRLVLCISQTDIRQRRKLSEICTASTEIRDLACISKTKIAMPGKLSWIRTASMKHPELPCRSQTCICTTQNLSCI